MEFRVVTDVEEQCLLAEAGLLYYRFKGTGAKQDEGWVYWPPDEWDADSLGITQAKFLRGENTDELCPTDSWDWGVAVE